MRLARAARAAPSGDNCQPWRLHWDGERLRVRFLAERAASFYDVEHAASWVSLGAVLTNLETAAGPLGLAVRAELFPRDEFPPTVASLTLEPAPRRDDPLAAAIEARTTNRRPYARRPLPEPLRSALEAAATSPGVTLSWATGPALARVARLAAANDRFLFEHRALHAGLVRWLRWTPEEAAAVGDGLPVAALELARWERPAFRLLASWRVARAARGLGLTALLPTRTAAIYRRSAAIGLLTVAGRDRLAFVQGGRALERVWLTATRHGVAFQPITGVTFLLLRLTLGVSTGFGPAERARLERLGRALCEVFPVLADQAPAMLFRVGFAAPPSARAPRLPLEAVLRCEGSGAAADASVRGLVGGAVERRS